MVRLDARGFRSYSNLFTSPNLIPPSPHLFASTSLPSIPTSCPPSSQTIFKPMPLQQLSPPSNSKTQERNRVSITNNPLLYPCIASAFPQRNLSAPCRSIDGSPILCAWQDFLPRVCTQKLRAAITHVRSKVLVIYYPLQVALSTTVRKSTTIYFVVTNSEKSWLELLGKTLAQQRQSPQFTLFPCPRVAHPPHTCEVYWDFQRFTDCF